MKNYWWLAVGGLLLSGLAVVAEEATSEEELSLDKIPAVVKATLDKQGGTIAECDRKTRDGKTWYEADVIKDGKKLEVRVAPDGALIDSRDSGEKPEGSEKEEGEHEDGDEDAKEHAQARESLAKAKVTLVQAIETALHEVRGAKAYAAELEVEDGKPQYSVDLMAGEEFVEVNIDVVTGKVIHVERAGADEKAGAGGWRETFKVDKADFTDTGRNDYFILEPGYRTIYEHRNEKLTITVLEETRKVDGVVTRIVEEREEKNGVPTEISRNYFAMDRKTGDIYYFGEDVDEYKGGKVASHGGGWHSGEKGATFGLMMPAKPKVGDRFYQEHAPKVAMDRAEIVAVDAELKVPSGTFKCVHVKETTPIESDTSHKWYAPGVGLVKDDEFVLVKVEKP